MKTFVWNLEKAQALRRDKSRNNIGFEECVVAIEAGRILADLPHPAANYSHQRILVLEIEGYAYAVPYVEDDNSIFLKTVFPSRKLTSIYLKGQASE